MAKKRYTSEQIIHKLREVDVLFGWNVLFVYELAVH